MCVSYLLTGQRRITNDPQTSVTQNNKRLFSSPVCGGPNDGDRAGLISAGPPDKSMVSFQISSADLGWAPSRAWGLASCWRTWDSLSDEGWDNLALHQVSLIIRQSSLCVFFL